MIVLKIFLAVSSVMLLWALIEMVRTDSSLPIHKRFWKSWLAVGHRIGSFNSRLILTLFYFLIITPYAIRMKLFGDPLHLTHKGWHARRTKDLTIKEASRQF